MLDHDAGAAREQWYGAQEAARFLGVHRSTLHIAVRQGLIVPDQYTPGRHARFKRATLDAFRIRLADHSATSDTAPQASQALARLANMLARSSEPEELAAAAIAGIRRVMPQVDKCCIAVRTGDPRDRDRMRLLAQHGIPAWVIDDYIRLRSTFRFATTTALRCRCPQTCEDTSKERLYSGTEHLLRSLHLGAYFVQPILAGEEPLGVVICLYSRPHMFTEVERTLMGGIADELATALANADQIRHLTGALTTSRVLMRYALNLRADAPSAVEVSAVEAEEGAASVAAHEQALGDLFKQLSGAEDVCALGFGRNLETRHPYLRDLACQACAGDEMAQRQWRQNGVQYTGIGASILLVTGLRAGVAAAWPGMRPFAEADHSLLVTFAGAYVIAANVE